MRVCVYIYIFVLGFILYSFTTSSDEVFVKEVTTSCQNTDLLETERECSCGVADPHTEQSYMHSRIQLRSVCMYSDNTQKHTQTFYALSPILVTEDIFQLSSSYCGKLLVKDVHLSSMSHIKNTNETKTVLDFPQ
jgi:hypothetical protein